MHRHTAAITCALSCGLASLAAQSSPLVLKTADARSAHDLCELLGSSATLPPLAEGEAWQIAVDDGGQPIATTVAGSAEHLTLEARPPALMELYAKQLRHSHAMLRGTAAVTLGRWGLPTKESVQIVRGLFAFPKQVKRLRARFVGDLDSELQCIIDLEPVPGTWFAELVTALQPTGQRIPMPDWRAPMAIAVDCDGRAVGRVLAPFSPLAAKLGLPRGEDAGARAAALDAFYAACGAGVAITVDPDHPSLTTVTRVRNAADLNRALTSPAFVAWSRALRGLGAGVDVDVTQAAFHHREVPITEIVVQGARVTGPWSGGSLATEFYAVAGQHMVSTMGCSEAVIRHWVDQVLDDALDTAELPPGIVVRVHAALGALDTWTGDDAEASPQDRMEIDIIHRQNALRLDITMTW